MRNSLGRFIKGHNLTKGSNSPRWKGGVSKIKRICFSCDKEFIARKYQVGKFCSIKCKGLWDSEHKIQQNSPSWKGGKPKCIDCGKVTKDYQSMRCLECALRFRKGENSHNWQGGITPMYKAIRNSLEYEEWRKKVLERDLYTCQHCGKVGGWLEVDHIKPFAFFPEMRFELSNGRTLCQPCHRKTDTYGMQRKEFYSCTS